MSYLEQFRPEAECQIAPLARNVEALTKQLAELRKRLANEQEHLAQHEREADKLKSLAGASLSGDTNGFEKFKVALRKKTALIVTSREVVDILGREVLPNVERELAEAKCALQTGLLDFAATCRPVCEAKMAELIGAVLAERDSFMAAFSQIFADFGGDFQGSSKLYPDGIHYRPDPLRADMMIGTGLEEMRITSDSIQRRRGDFLTEPPQGPGSTGNVPTAAPESTNAPEPALDTPEGAIVDSDAVSCAQDATQDGQEVQDVPQDILFEAQGDDSGPAAVPVDSEEGQARIGNRALPI